MKRLFVAVKIHPSPELLQVYYSSKKDLALEKIRWVEESNFHLTLKFLGNTHTSLIAKIDRTLKSVSLNTPSFEMHFHDAGIFGSRYAPRVIWLGIENSTQLNEFADNVLNELDQAGFLRDRQNFVPHLTIGRIKHIHSKKHLKNVIDKHKGNPIHQETVNEFYLYESILKREGPVYKVLKVYSLE